ncbi:hypothetical protein [Alicyclobacillus kakegawensis]|nr:hypothetical protein [Alicyclobacillus kakegawensis]
MGVGLIVTVVFLGGLLGLFARQTLTAESAEHSTDTSDSDDATHPPHAM